MTYFFFLMIGLTFSSLTLANYKIDLLPLIVAFIGNSLLFTFIFYSEKNKNLEIKCKNLLQFSIYLFSFVIALIFSMKAFTLFLAIAIYLWYLDKNFFIENWLKKKIFFKKFLESVIYIPITLFPYALHNSNYLENNQLISYCLLVFLTFFFHRFSREIDPFSHPKNPKYIHFYGFKRLFYICSLLLFLSAICTASLGYQFFLWPLQFSLFLSLCLGFLDSKKYKFIQACTDIYSIAAIWSVFIYSLVR